MGFTGTPVFPRYLMVEKPSFPDVPQPQEPRDSRGGILAKGSVSQGVLVLGCGVAEEISTTWDSEKWDDMVIIIGTKP